MSRFSRKLLYLKLAFGYCMLLIMFSQQKQIIKFFQPTMFRQANKSSNGWMKVDKKIKLFHVIKFITDFNFSRPAGTSGKIDTRRAQFFGPGTKNDMCRDE